MHSGSNPLAPYIDDICSHMNQDHADALVLFCVAYAGLQVTSARMVHIDPLGFDVIPEGSKEPVRIPFSQPVRTPNEVRKAMVEMLKQAREEKP